MSMLNCFWILCFIPQFLTLNGPVVNGTIKNHTNKTSRKDVTDLAKKNKFINDITNSMFYENCQNTSEYGCFVAPVGCEKTSNCTLGAIWKATAEDIYEFQLISSSGDFVAVGFPYVATMGPAPVVACSPQFSKAEIYFNSAKYTNSVAFNHSELVTSYKVENGEESTLSCTFTMNSTFSVASTNTSGEIEYDLNVNKTYIVLALGPVVDGYIKIHAKTGKSNNIVDLTKHNNFLPDATTIQPETTQTVVPETSPTSVPQTTTTMDSPCPTGWMDAGPLGCFQFHTNMTVGSWFEANLLCEDLGGFLMEPKSEDVQTFFASLLTMLPEVAGTSDWWIGLTDIGHEGSWLWIHDAEFAVEHFWAPTFPDGEPGNDADCVMMSHADGYLWHDTYCESVQAIGVICQL